MNRKEIKEEVMKLQERLGFTSSDWWKALVKEIDADLKKERAATATLSTRITPTQSKWIDAECKKQGINRSQWLCNMIAKQCSNEFFIDNGKLKVKKK